MKTEMKDIKKYVQKTIFFLKKAKDVFVKYARRFILFLKESWKSVIVFVPIFLVVYYLGGAFLSHKINTDLRFGPDNVKKGYTVVQMAADLIERETDKNLYTPNLPFVFPAYVLDNMPAFQKGILESVRGLVNVLAEGSAEENIIKAKELLNYAPDVWLFSKTKDFKIAPSSVAQYRKARRKLMEFNKHIQKSDIVLEKIRAKISADLWDISVYLESQLKTVGFFKADDVFYEALGRLYADYLFLKCVQNNMPQTQSALEALEDALSLRPLIVRGGALGHTFGANHLLELSYFALKAHTFLLDGYFSSIR